MTAGQHGPDQQGWQQPPQGPPAYPAYGQQPGPPPHGYAPAPSAGWGAPPEPMERPQTVRIGIGAFVANLILGLISSFVQLSDTDGFIDQVREADPSITREAAEGLLTVGLVIGFLFVGLQALFIWFAWKGRNWARIVLWVLGGIGIVFGLVGLAGSGATNASGFLTSLGVFSLLLLIVGVVALALKPSSEWYRHEGWRRSVTR